MDKAMCTSIETDIVTQTIHAEILNRILRFRDDSNYLLRPKSLVIAAITFLHKREIKQERRDRLNELLFR